MSLLECRELTKSYGGKAALNHIDLNIESGHIIGLLGPNGSGKTTFIKLCNGLLVPSSGSVLIEGSKPCAKTKAIVSYLPERGTLPEWMTTAEAAEYYRDFFSDFSTEKAMKMIKSLNLDLNQSIRTMSKGTREKLHLILTMSRNAKLYFLDEPIGGVDPATRDYILNTIISNYNENSTVIISTHLIADVEKILDEVIILKDGSLVSFDNVDNIRASCGKSIDEVFREVFRC